MVGNNLTWPFTCKDKCITGLLLEATQKYKDTTLHNKNAVHETGKTLRCGTLQTYQINSTKALIYKLKDLGFRASS